MTDFKGRKALISGATRGIGRAIAKTFLEAGATVIGVYGSNHKAAESFSQEWRASDSFAENRLFLHQCDISDESLIESVRQLAKNRRPYAAFWEGGTKP